MKTRGRSLQLISFVFSFGLFVFSSLSTITTPPHLGIPPEDEKYFGSELIKCKEESKYFTLDRLNDDFCDCVDGTDEPGTSACPKSKFYCRNVGSTPKLLFSSRVNDHLCDCCDGSDEYDGSVSCPNTCFKDGNVVNKIENYKPKTTHLSNTDLDKKTNPLNLEDLIQKIKDLRIIVVLEVVIVSSVITYRLLRWRFRSRRRNWR